MGVTAEHNMHKRRAPTGSRGSWRQQQMVAAAAERAAAQPTLAMRPLLLQVSSTTQCISPDGNIDLSTSKHG